MITRIIRDNKRELIKVMEDTEGRGLVLVYLSPNETDGFDIFHVGISWDSLQKLQEAAFYDIFHWAVGDGSLVIRGNSRHWRLRLVNHRSGLALDVNLTGDETNLLRECLLTDPALEGRS